MKENKVFNKGEAFKTEENKKWKIFEVMNEQS